MIGPASMMYLISVAFTGGEICRSVFDDASVFLHPIPQAAACRRNLSLRRDLQVSRHRKSALPGGSTHLPGEFLGGME